jgi:hypothetical protein
MAYDLEIFSALSSISFYFIANSFGYGFEAVGIMVKLLVQKRSKFFLTV